VCVIVGSLVEGSAMCCSNSGVSSGWVAGWLGTSCWMSYKDFRLLPFHDFNHLSGGKSWFYFAELTDR
jgi:hypothetical protein